MKKIRLTAFFVCLIFYFIVVSNFAQADNLAPEKLLRQVTEQMLVRLNLDKTKITSDPNYVYTLVDQILVPYVDFTEMSKRVLATNWRAATDKQRTDFAAEFKVLVIRTYATAFKSYKNEQVEITGVRYGHSNKQLVEVTTLVKQTSGPDISVNYRMINKDSAWKVYDLIVEGVGLVSSFNSQFTESIRAKGLDAVILDLKTHNAAGIAK